MDLKNVTDSDLMTLVIFRVSFATKKMAESKFNS